MRCVCIRFRCPVEVKVGVLEDQKRREWGTTSSSFLVVSEGVEVRSLERSGDRGGRRRKVTRKWSDRDHDRHDEDSGVLGE